MLTSPAPAVKAKLTPDMPSIQALAETLPGLNRKTMAPTKAAKNPEVFIILNSIFITFLPLS
jgi:hypothetical protein